MTGEHTDSWVDFDAVQITGTQNALATLGKINLVGGHEEWQLWPGSGEGH
ncbi:MAG: hypothetical protein ABJL99_12585 [Aliishimia sp.]